MSQSQVFNTDKKLISLSRLAHSSKPAAAAEYGMMGWTDGHRDRQTDARQFQEARTANSFYRTLSHHVGTRADSLVTKYKTHSTLHRESKKQDTKLLPITSV